MTPRLTDDEVSGLPLATARAELLEEIMSTPLSEPTEIQPATRSRRHWSVPLAAAAAVAALVAAPTYLLAGGGADAPTPAGGAGRTAATEPTTPPVATAHEWLVLDAAGWQVVYSSGAEGWHEVQYENGDQRLDISVVAAELRDGYVEDRQRLDYPDVDPGTPVQLAGADALMWPYSADDHTAIGVAVQGVYPEARGAGMGREAYVELIGQLRWTDQSGFEASLPDTSVTGSEREDVVDEMLRDVPVPPSWEAPGSTETDRYQLGAAVAGSVSCQWIDEFARATRSGDQAAAARAAEAMSTSRDWAILQEMDATGDYPDVVWELADELAAGHVPQGYSQALGCP
ncbi:hypothetical protein SAMN04489844_0969 [Nocardioides exalbidus]|uniref:Uncharacterized protein n=1 Tax=Nocardioides exalbidus TaxID=402596 RepID=A0A1H4LV71_9ACTN|nr:hypothetical protein [Nocardioides exalbidus]SEB74467.1 hypothetical protein SAMN04489844_0969 [Nocardioides exalbidus]